MVFIIELVFTLLKHLFERIIQTSWDLWDQIYAIFLDLCINLIIIRKVANTTVLVTFFLVCLYFILKRSTILSLRNWERRDKHMICFTLCHNFLQKFLSWLLASKYIWWSCMCVWFLTVLIFFSENKDKKHRFYSEITCLLSMAIGHIYKCKYQNMYQKYIKIYISVIKCKTKR